MFLSFPRILKSNQDTFPENQDLSNPEYWNQ